MTEPLIPTAYVLPTIGLAFVLGLVQAWRHTNGTTAAARITALTEELEALKQEHEELQTRVRALERNT